MSDTLQVFPAQWSLFFSRNRWGTSGPQSLAWRESPVRFWISSSTLGVDGCSGTDIWISRSCSGSVTITAFPLLAGSGPPAVLSELFSSSR